MKYPRMSGHFLPYPRATDINDIDIMDGRREKKVLLTRHKGHKVLGRAASARGLEEKLNGCCVACV